MTEEDSLGVAGSVTAGAPLTLSGRAALGWKPLRGRAGNDRSSSAVLVGALFPGRGHFAAVLLVLALAFRLGLADVQGAVLVLRLWPV